MHAFFIKDIRLILLFIADIAINGVKRCIYSRVRNSIRPPFPFFPKFATQRLLLPPPPFYENFKSEKK